MSKSYDLIEAKILGRRLFIKAGGAVVLTSALPACEASPSDGDTSAPADTSDASVSPPVSPDVSDPVTRADTASPDVGPGADVGPTGSDECLEWTPDPLGEGADAHPFESGAPPGGWGEEIPPISDNAGFYVTNYFGIAHVDPCAWRLEVAVRGETVATLDLETIYAMEGQEREHTLQCVESRPILMKMNNAVWTGRPLVDVLDELGVVRDPALTGLRLLCADSYEVGLPVEELDVPLWLVWRMNGELLPPEHGFPVRLLCPGRFGWQNVKQLVGLDFIEGDPSPGYQKVWATHYSVQGLIAHPETMALSASGETVRLLGKAYGGSDPVVWVGVSVDGGETYQDAELTYAPGPDRWTLWRFEWAPPAAGIYPVKCAARTASGVETTPSDDMSIPYTDGMTIALKVS